MRICTRHHHLEIAALARDGGKARERTVSKLLAKEKQRDNMPVRYVFYKHTYINPKTARYDAVEKGPDKKTVLDRYDACNRDRYNAARRTTFRKEVDWVNHPHKCLLREEKKARDKPVRQSTEELMREDLEYDQCRQTGDSDLKSPAAKDEDDAPPYEPVDPVGECI